MNKFTLILLILICILFLGGGMFWYAQTKPIAITGQSGSEPLPQPIGSDVPTTSPIQQSETPDAPPDTRSWGERLRDPTVPDVPGVAWQTYTNKEYGFQMEYPKGWGIRASKHDLIKGVELQFYRLSDPPNSLLGMSIFRGQLRDELIRRGSRTWTERIQKYGFVPDAKINDINLYIEYADQASHEVLLSAFLEKNGNICEIFAGDNGYDDIDRSIIEHIVKTFQFFK